MKDCGQGTALPRFSIGSSSIGVTPPPSWIPSVPFWGDGKWLDAKFPQDGDRLKSLEGTGSLRGLADARAYNPSVPMATQEGLMTNVGHSTKFYFPRVDLITFRWAST